MTSDDTMKPMIVVAVVVSMLSGFLGGLAWGIKIQFRDALLKAGLSRDAGKLYGRAVRIFRRQAGLMLIDSELTGDVLSPESRKLVLDWLADYRRLAEKGDPGTVTETV